MTATNIANIIDNIIENNIDVICEYFSGVASCSYYDGTCYQLYLDLDDNSLRINHEASTNSWLQRDDGSLIMVHRVSGYCDTPAEERYNAERGDDLCDFGYPEWVDYELIPSLEHALATTTGQI